MSQILSSAAVIIGAFRVNSFILVPDTNSYGISVRKRNSPKLASNYTEMIKFKVTPKEVPPQMQ